jgi:anthranilate synthase component I
MIRPTLDEFRRLARDHARVPVYREILADLESPVSAFRKLAAEGDAALLESMEGGEHWARYSILGCDPGVRFESRGTRVRVTRDGGVEEFDLDRPLSALDRIVDGLRSARLPELPGLAGGAIGFVSYDAVRRFERLPATARDELALPDARFTLFGSAVLFDHRAHTVKIVVHVTPGNDPEGAWRRAVAQIDERVARLTAPAPETDAPAARAAPHVASTVSRERFCAAVERAREYIRAGDVVQVVLAHRLEVETDCDPFDVYRALRVINPSPYLFHLKLDDLTLVGSSPEVLVRRAGRRVEVRPIAGTRPRGLDEEADRALEAELRGSEKERAEHVMLVDLGRNDLGRICAWGSVQTTEYQVVERYSHVMHLVSHVEGELREEMGNADVLEACFPAGTVSGAPKVRAMEIIEELEPVRRGIYAGAVGYLDFHGNMDTAIAIRTLLFRGGRAYLGVGAGIVADSDPAAEYDETLRKGSALLRAIEVAHAGLSSFSREASARAQEPVPLREEGPPR